MIPNRKRTPSRWLLSGLAVLASVPLLVGAGADNPAQLAENRQRIAGMSPYERAELEENYAKFRELPEAEREQYRRLHAELAGNSQLREILGDYQNWLRTLTPYQRLELRAETDWARRLEIVRRFRQEQQSEQQRRRLEEQRPSMRPFVWFHGLPRLEPDDLAAVMRVIQQSLPDSSIEQQVQGTSKPVRYVRILTASLKQAIEQQNTSPSNLQWPDPRTMDRILEAISDDRDRDRFEELHTGNDYVRQTDPDGGRLMLAMIMHSIDSLWWFGTRDFEVTDDDVSRILNQLPEPTRTEIQFESRTVRERRIRWELLTERRREFRQQESQELIGIFEEFWPPPADFGPGPGPGGRGFPGGRGDRRPGDARRGPGDEGRGVGPSGPSRRPDTP